MKKIIVALTVLCLAFAPLSIVQAQSNGETIRISLDFAPDTVYVSTSDNIVLYHGWGACTRGLVRLYLTAVHTELGINSEIVSIADGKDQFWGSITQGLSHSQYCMGGSQQNGWSVYWDYPLGALPLGEYEVYYRQWVDHPIIDGGDYDGDGRPDMWEGGPTRTFTIVVQ